jgi:hypothetical protein
MVELFANATFDPLPTPDDLGGAQPDTALPPTVCFAVPGATVGAKCQAVLSAAPPAEVNDGLTQRVVAAGCLDLRALPRRQGAAGEDAYLVARAQGPSSTLFPIVPGNIPGSVAIADLVDPARVPAAVGAFPLAITSAVLVDVDGGGWRGLFE